MFLTPLTVTHRPAAVRIFGPAVLEVDAIDNLESGFFFLAQPLVWKDAVFGTLEAPIGFRSNLASTPQVLRNLSAMDPSRSSRRPAVMHDWLYGEQSRGKDFADRFLRAALLAEGASSVTAAAYYYGVHWFGGIAWAEDKAEGKPEFEPGPYYDDWKNSLT